MVKQSGMFEAVAVAAVAAVEPEKVACDRFIERLDTMRCDGFYAQSCEILKPSGILCLGTAVARSGRRWSFLIVKDPDTIGSDCHPVEPLDDGTPSIEEARLMIFVMMNWIAGEDSSQRRRQPRAIVVQSQLDPRAFDSGTIAEIKRGFDSFDSDTR